MADETVTVEALEAHPEWAESGVKVGDPIPEDKSTTENPKVAVKKKETIEVDVEMLKNILRDVEELRVKVGKVDQLTKENEMLLAVADKGRIANYQAKNNPQGLVRSARAWTWKVAGGEKLVKATLTVRNEVFTDTNGRVFTDQVLNVILEDGTEMEVAYDRFMKEKGLVEGDIIKRSTNDENGQTFYTLKLKDGKEFTVNYLFLN